MTWLNRRRQRRRFEKWGQPGFRCGVPYATFPQFTGAMLASTVIRHAPATERLRRAIVDRFRRAIAGNPLTPIARAVTLFRRSPRSCDRARIRVCRWLCDQFVAGREIPRPYSGWRSATQPSTKTWRTPARSRSRAAAWWSTTRDGRASHCEGARRRQRCNVEPVFDVDGKAWPSAVRGGHGGSLRAACGRWLRMYSLIELPERSTVLPAPVGNRDAERPLDLEDELEHVDRVQSQPIVEQRDAVPDRLARRQPEAPTIALDPSLERFRGFGIRTSSEEAAVDANHLTGDIARGVGRKRPPATREMRGVPIRAGGHRLQISLESPGTGRQSCRISINRGNGIDEHPVPRHVSRQRAREAFEPGLRRGSWPAGQRHERSAMKY